MIRSGLKDGNGLVAVPVAPYLQTMLVEPAAAVAMAQLIRVEVLERFLIHSLHHSRS
jgi:hypothetical protein